MRRQHLVVYFLYLALAGLITWPLLTVIGTRFIGHPFGDSYEYAHHIWWIKHALQTGQPVFYQPLLGYPDGLSALWLWAVPLQSFPAWLFAFVLPLPAAFNLSILLRLALNGWSMYVLVRHLTGRTGPALLAGAIFMTFPTFQGQLAAGHTGLLALWPVPLYIHALLRLQANDTGAPARRVMLTALLFAVSLWGSILLLIYLVGPVTLLMLLLPLLRRDWRALARSAAAVMLGGLIALIFIGPFISEPGASMQMREGGDVLYSADLLTLVTPSFYHPLFTHLPYTHHILGIDPFERMGYAGIAAGLLALVGVWRRRLARRWLALALAAWILSLGPLLKVLNTVVSIDLGEQVTYGTLPRLLFQDVPLISLARTPARFNFVVALALTIMAGYGAAVLWDRLKRRRWLVFAALLAVIVFEYQSFWPFPTISGTVPEPVQVLAHHDDVRAVFNLPWQHLLAQKDGMFLQTGHHQPIIAGHITRRTPVSPAKLTVLQDTLDPALLDREGVDILILHKEWAEDAATMQAALPGDLLYEDARIAVYEVPPPGREPQFTPLAPDAAALETHLESYLFAPEPGWTTLSGRLQTEGRDVALLLDSQRVREWRGMDTVVLDVPVPVVAGYHTLTLAVEPPCPQHFPAALRCRSVRVDELAFGAFVPDAPAEVVPFERDVELAGYRVDADRRAVWLWWRFGEHLTENDIRFVHVVDTAGGLVAQDDHSLGTRPAGDGWAEQIAFPDLPAGTYAVYTGWYTYPDLTHFSVRADVPGAADGRVYLGQMVID